MHLMGNSVCLPFIIMEKIRYLKEYSWEGMQAGFGQIYILNVQYILYLVNLLLFLTDLSPLIQSRWE